MAVEVTGAFSSLIMILSTEKDGGVISSEYAPSPPKQQDREIVVICFHICLKIL
jgi:hypothetical protein